MVFGEDQRNENLQEPEAKASCVGGIYTVNVRGLRKMIGNSLLKCKN